MNGTSQFDLFNTNAPKGDLLSFIQGPSKSANTGVDFPLSNGNFQTPSQQVNESSFDFGGQGGANIAAGIQGVGSLANAYMAYKQFQLGKKTLAQNKSAFNLNAANQAKITNAQIEDRARRRALENQSIQGDLKAIEAATAAEYEKRKISGKGI